MGMRRLEFGDSLSGLLIDGVEDTPYVGATLRLTVEKGVAVEVPYLADVAVEQFGHVRAWFDKQTPPPNMYVLTPEGGVSLFDIAWSGHSERWGGTSASIGSLRPTLTVLGNRDGPVSDPLVMKELHSRMDGLNRWAGLTSMLTESETNHEGRVQGMTVLLASDAGFTWTQGEATVSIRSSWLHTPEHDGYDDTATVTDFAFIETSFSSGPRPFWDHFVEQRKIANLLVFLFGRPLSFREHKLRDDLFASRMMDGRIYNHPLTEVISRNTYRERTRDIPSWKELDRPIAYMSQIGIEGLTRWSENYEKWERFILPSVSVLNKTERFIEDIVTSTSMSLEAAGSIIGKRPGEEVTHGRGRGKATTATFVYRCLDVLDVQWPERIQCRVGLSRAIANNYNDVKHYDRGDFPNHRETRAVSEINQLIVRFLAIYISGRGDELLDSYRKGENLFSLEQTLDSLGLRIDDKGDWKLDDVD